ncbi:Pleiotropic negative transcriptional regulator, partial [Irineochytrium annulatum]
MSDRKVIRDLYITQCYRTLDQMENFKLKISLKRVANRHFPFYDTNTIFVNDDTRKTVASVLPAPVEVTIRWQKKIPKPEPKVASPSTDVAKKNACIDRLFTFVNDENYEDAEDMTRSLTTGFKEPTPPAARRKRPVRKRNLEKEGRQQADDRYVSLRAVHTETPMTDSRFQIMHIIASMPVEQLRFPMGKTEKAYVTEYFEKRLCTIRAYDNGVITTTPPISKKRDVYQFSICDDVFQYTIQTASRDLEEEDEQKEWSLFTEYYNNKYLARIRDFPIEFSEMPEAYGLKVCILGDITSATNFERRDVYVHYLIELADGWSTSSESERPILSSRTQVSHSTYDVETCLWTAHFAYPIELEIVTQKPPEQVKWPRIHFEVSAIDRWERHSVEGYGSMEMPRKAGTHEILLRTWRPSGGTFAKVKTAFIGGSPELEDIGYTAYPSGFNVSLSTTFSLLMALKGTRLNKYGFQTETSGEVALRLNIMHQAGNYQKAQPKAAEADLTAFVKSNARTIS